eukprot:TRINITY_DN603_c0_g3_i2.p1 TRINITY_DN603_c0_g3~~TRINITY_DN603_c0_g3_i2.p1  ORF type:complete len:247 (+),score=18.36 TRINITY_DN603_c0_g3_i2:243-983(+)
MITLNDTLWSLLVDRDFPGLTKKVELPTSKSSSTSWRQIYKEEKCSLRKKLHFISTLTGYYDESMDGSRNAEYHLVGLAFRGEVDELKKLFNTLQEGTIEAINKYYFYDKWAYYGNFSHSHSAYIALVSDVMKMKDRPFELSQIESSGYEFCVYRGPSIEPPSDFFYPYEGPNHARIPMKHDPNKRGTLLHWAVLGGNYHCVKFLLDNYYPGVKLDAKVVAYGVTAYDIAVMNSYWDIAKLIKSFI